MSNSISYPESTGFLVSGRAPVQKASGLWVRDWSSGDFESCAFTPVVQRTYPSGCGSWRTPATQIPLKVNMFGEVAVV